MVAGWDHTGPRLFYVDSDGSRLEGDKFSVGSGSTFAYGVLDSKDVKNMGLEEAIDVARRSIFHATHRDAYSGGSVNGTYFQIYKCSICYSPRWLEIHKQ